MPRTSRTVAQRLATQNKGRKRRMTRPGAAVAPEVEQILDEVAPAEPVRGVGEAPAVAAAPRGGLPRPAARSAPARRAFSEYGAEYRYVWTDLQRIALVAGALLVLLIVLSFFIS